MKTILFACLAATVVLLVSCSEETIAPKEDLKTSIKSNPLVPYSYTALPNGTVELSFTNNTGTTIIGDVIREGVSYLQNGYIIHEFSVAAGESYTFIDDNVIPATYRYIFEYAPAGTSDYTLNFDTVTVNTNVPALGDILLLPPDGGEAYETLRNGYQIQIGGTNIQAETDATYTRSVVYYLNGVRYKDNTAPFTVFPEGTANLTNGDYTLMAIAYPKKNGKGVAGDTTTVTFSVNNLY